MEIRCYRPDDEQTVIRLWERCGLIRPWNDPRKDIERKLSEQPELFLVGQHGDEVIATAMAGFDGHRGWVYYLAVAPEQRGKSHRRAPVAGAGLSQAEPASAGIESRRARVLPKARLCAGRRRQPRTAVGRGLRPSFHISGVSWRISL